MKKAGLIYILILLNFALFTKAYASAPLTIYLKNGDFEVFNVEDVDSISVSHFDADSVWHEEIVSQIVWTNGNKHLKMIAEIDSVSFTPIKNVTYPGVKEISEEIYGSLINVDMDKYQWVMIDSPEISALPSVGERYYTLDMYRGFPIGFMGEVTNVVSNDGYATIDFKPLDYQDIFQSFYGEFETEIYSTNISRSPSDKPKNAQATNPKSYAWMESLQYSKGFEVESPLYDLAEIVSNYDNHVNVSMTPNFNVRTLVAVLNGKRCQTISVSGSLDVRTEVELNLSLSKEIKEALIDIDRPLPIAPMICMYAESGPVMNLSADCAVSVDAQRTFELTAEFHKSSDSYDSPRLSYAETPLKLNSTNTFVCGSGTLDVGVYVELGIESLAEALRKKFDKEFDLSLGNLGIGFEGGLRLNINADFDKDDWQNSTKNTNLYKALTKPDNFTVGLFGQSYASASLLNLNYDCRVDFHAAPLYQKSLLPKFSDISINMSNASRLRVEAPYKAGICRPTLAFVSYDTLNPSDYKICNVGKSSGNDDTARGDFEYPGFGQTHRYQPYMQQGQKLILADPSITYNSHVPEISVELTDEYVYLETSGNVRYQLADPVYIVRIKIKDLPSNNRIGITVKPDVNIDKSNGRMLNSNQWNSYDRNHYTIFTDQADVENNEVEFEVLIPLDDVNIYFVNHGNQITLKIPLTIELTDFHYSDICFNRMVVKTYNVTHQIYNPIFLQTNGYPTAYPEKITGEVKYAGKVTGLVVYALFYLYTTEFHTQYGRIPIESFFHTFGGVVEEFPDRKEMRLRDGNFDHTIRIDGLHCCKESVESELHITDLDALYIGYYDATYVHELPQESFDIYDYYKLGLNFDTIELCWKGKIWIDRYGERSNRPQFSKISDIFVIHH